MCIREYFKACSTNFRHPFLSFARVFQCLIRSFYMSVNFLTLSLSFCLAFPRVSFLLPGYAFSISSTPALLTYSNQPSSARKICYFIITMKIHIFPNYSSFPGFVCPFSSKYFLQELSFPYLHLFLFFK